MKIITEPKVYLMGYQKAASGGYEEFLKDHEVSAWTTDAEEGAETLIETAGRLCYMSFAKPRPGGAKAYLENILESGHGSVLEHGVWNFIVTGISRSCSHEFVRHRAGFGYSQLSQRYVDESVAEYIIPDIINADVDLKADWEQAVYASHIAYIKLCEALDKKLAHITDKTLRRKTARQAARSVLPNATETKIFVTANTRALRHFIELRGTRFAEPEIRRVAIALMKIMKLEAPNIFSDYSLSPIPDDEMSMEIIGKYRKV